MAVEHQLGGLGDLSEMFSEDNMDETLDTLMQNLGLDEMLSSLESMFADIQPIIDGFFVELGIDNPFEEPDEAEESDESESVEVASGGNQFMIDQINANPEVNGFVGKFEGNGNRDASVITHANFDPNQPYEIVYHLHGTHGQDPTNNDRFNRSLNTFISSTGSQTVFVYPLSGGVRSRNPEEHQYDEQWFKEPDESFSQFHDQTQAVLASQFGASSSNVNHVTLQAHSAGGFALQNVTQSGFAPDRIVFLDASYGSWARNTYQNAIAHNPDIDFQVIVKQGTETEQRASSLEGRSNVNFIRTDASHTDIINRYFGGISPRNA